MPDIRTTVAFDRWLKRLRDQRGKAAILTRIDRLRAGHAGNVRSVGRRVSEMRIDLGPGYRVYFAPLRGDKGSQQRDIAKAQQLASELQ